MFQAKELAITACNAIITRFLRTVAIEARDTVLRLIVWLSLRSMVLRNASMSYSVLFPSSARGSPSQQR